MATIELIGPQWGNWGGPEVGDRVEAEWIEEIGSWVFEHSGTEWFAYPGGPKEAWTAQEVEQ